MKTVKSFFLVLALLINASNLPSHSVKESIESQDRTPQFTTRDVYRHPYETLTFFNIQPDMTVVELNPGGGWYTEILANC